MRSVLDGEVAYGSVYASRLAGKVSTICKLLWVGRWLRAYGGFTVPRIVIVLRFILVNDLEFEQTDACKFNVFNSQEADSQ